VDRDGIAMLGAQRGCARERLGLPSPLMVAAKHKIVRRTKLCMSASSFAMASFPSPIA